MTERTQQARPLSEKLRQNRALWAARLVALERIGLRPDHETPLLDEQVVAICEAYAAALAPVPGPGPRAEPTSADVEAIEEAVGMGAGAWDMVDPKKIVAAAWALRAAALVPEPSPAEQEDLGNVPQERDPLYDYSTHVYHLGAEEIAEGAVIAIREVREAGRKVIVEVNGFNALDFFAVPERPPPLIIDGEDDDPESQAAALERTP